MNVDKLVKLLDRYRLPVEPEAMLQEAIAIILRDNGIPFAREVKLTSTDRIDFMVCDSIGIECKCNGSALALARQVGRYEDSKQLQSILVVVTRKRLAVAGAWVPGTFAKPLRVFVTKAL